MSIKSEINKSATYLRSARKAILGRGGEISLTAGLKDFADAIYKIPADASLAYQVDDSVAYRKVVPASAEEFSQVAKVGGMTYKTRNLIPSPTKSLTTNGITFSVQEDGSIVANGTATANATYNFSDFGGLNFNLTVGTKYRLSGCPAGGGNPYMLRIQSAGREQTATSASSPNVEFTANYGEWFAFIWIAAGTVANNLVFHPMVSEGSEIIPYEPYFEGLRDTAVRELVGEGANLLKYPYFSTTMTKLGITFTDNGDGTVTVDGTATGQTDFYFIASWKSAFFKKGDYYGSGCPDGGVGAYYVDFGFKNADGVVIAEKFISSSEGMAFALEEDATQLFARIRIMKDTTINNLVFEPMINRGTMKAPYKPYRAEAVDTLEIAEEIQALDGYGRGVEGYPNYSDFERKVFRQNTYRKVFDGTENCLAVVSNTSGKHRIAYTTVVLDVRPLPSPNGSFVMPTICTHYDSISGDATYKLNRGVCIGTASQIIFYDEAYNTSDVSLWKAHLAELYANGNPLVVEYAIAEPIETDISAYLPNDNFIAVEGGGTIKAVNEYEYDAPSTINYIYKTVGE